MSVLVAPPAPVLRKRKSVDDDDHSYDYVPAAPRAIKQPRRLERFQMESDHDMALPSFEMASEAPMAYNQPSPTPSAESSPTSEYPVFQLYPTLPDPDAMEVDPASALPSGQDNIGLLGLQALGERHNNCTQMPRLQIANHPGLEGRRAMYSQCMQCGGISKVQTL